MSKSLGNYTTLEKIEDQGFSTRDFRLAVFASHYSTQANFTWKLMSEARSRHYRWQALAALIFQLVDDPVVDDQVFIEALVSTKKQVLGALNDNLNTPLALRFMDELINKYLQFGWSTKVAKPLEDLIEVLDALFGLQLQKNVVNLTKDQAEICQIRDQARIHQDFESGDNSVNNSEIKALILSMINTDPAGSLF